MNSKTIYISLCEKGKSLKESYAPFSGLHRHHITPKHSGGTDEEENFTYLTPREHTIAHYLLWRIYRNPNDLRSMKMLGANLSTHYRRKIGLFCKENNIGFHVCSKEQRLEWSLRGLGSQKASGSKDTFYYWSTKEGRKERSSLGGKKGSSSQIKTKTGIHTDNKKLRSQYASLGGKAHKGKRCMYKPGDKTFTRVKPEDINSFLEQGYIFGSPHKPHNAKK